MKNILIIEDEEKVVQGLKAYLEKSGYNVYVALNGLTRKKIEEDSKNPRYIITVVKAGYKFGGDN